MIFCSLDSEEHKQIKCRVKSQFSLIIELVRCLPRLTLCCLVFLGGDVDTADMDMP